jgi:hypothetical protein
MPDSPSTLDAAVYQLRIVLRLISPLIWRRLLVRSDSTVADLHRTLQVTFGWSDEHLHPFVIQGRLYGDDSLFDSRRVRLADLGLRLRERFVYEYDFLIAGSMTCGSSRSCRWADASTQSALAADEQPLPRIVVAHGHSSSSSNATRQSASLPACSNRCHRCSPIPASMVMTTVIITMPMMAISLTITMLVIASKNSTRFCAGYASIASIAGRLTTNWRSSRCRLCGWQREIPRAGDHRT